MHTYDLNGSWELTYNTINNKEEKWNRWIPAVVPGDVHLDLMREGLICDPLIADNNKKDCWIEEKEWWYKKEFFIEGNFLKEKTELVCEGLDLTADIWLNGKKIGSANNMFITHRFDITKYVNEGENEILIRLDVGFEAVKDAPVEKFQELWSIKEPRRPWMRKAQQSFSWDVAPRLITCGIWRDIYIESFEEAIIRDVQLTSTFDEKAAVLNIETDLEFLSKKETFYNVRVDIKDETTNISKESQVLLSTGMNTAKLAVEIPNPKLWWPNGMGEQHLYQVTVTVLDKNNKVSFGQKTFKYGIRSITINQDPINETEKYFTFIVNGQKAFCKGGNWVPSDAIYARINRQKEYELIKYAHDANFNMLRIWGGGVYPDTFFYEICDELGIMVWQDFMYACAYYPDDEPAFCNEAEHEAEMVVKKFRNHPSLAIWSGNNETYQIHSRRHPDGVFYGAKIFNEIQPEVIKRLDPTRYYHPGSPYPGPWPGQEKQGDQHVWWYTLGWHRSKSGGNENSYFSEVELNGIMKIWNYTELNFKFLSEFGIFCPSNMSSIRKFMGEYPATTYGDVYEHHRNYYETPDFILEMLRRYYKERKEYSLEEFTIAGQMSQAECLKYILEELRSRMHICSGVLFWEYNDTWGHVGYAPVDYYLSLKPDYHYMKRAFEHLHAILKNQTKTVYLLNDTTNSYDLEVEYGCMTFTGNELFKKRQKVSIKPCSSLIIDSIEKEVAQLADLNGTFSFVNVYRNGELVDRINY